LTEAKKVPKKTQKSLLLEIQKKKGFLMDFLLGKNRKKIKRKILKEKKKVMKQRENRGARRFYVSC